MESRKFSWLRGSISKMRTIFSGNPGTPGRDSEPDAEPSAAPQPCFECPEAPAGPPGAAFMSILRRNDR